MDFFDVVASRYSHKQAFLPTPVPLEHLERIARAGLAAPTAANRQAVHLLILKDEAQLEPLRAAVGSSSAPLGTAPAAIVLLTDSGTQGERNFEVEDYSVATGYMLLAAFALGYASGWLDSPFFDDEARARAERALGVPDGYRIWVALPIGLPDGEGTRREKKPFEQRVSYGRFGAHEV